MNKNPVYFLLVFLFVGMFLFVPAASHASTNTNQSYFQITSSAFDGITYVNIVPTTLGLSLNGTASIVVLPSSSTQTNSIYNDNFSTNTGTSFNIPLQYSATLLIYFNNKVIAGPVFLQYSLVSSQSSGNNTTQTIEIVLIAAISLFLVERINDVIEKKTASGHSLLNSGFYDENNGGSEIRKVVQEAKKTIKDKPTMDAYLEMFDDLQQSGIIVTDEMLKNYKKENENTKISEINQNFERLKKVS